MIYRGLKHPLALKGGEILTIFTTLNTKVAIINKLLSNYYNNQLLN